MRTRSRLVGPLLVTFLLACSGDDPDPETPAIDPTGVWVAASPDGTFKTALLTDASGTIAYVCDGASEDQWFAGSGVAADAAGSLVLEVDSEARTLEATFSADAVNGVVRGLGAAEVAFSGSRAAGSAGLFRADGFVAGEVDDAGIAEPLRKLSGWIVDADGEVTGVTATTPGSKESAPPTPPASGQLAGVFSCGLVAPERPKFADDLAAGGLVKPPANCELLLKTTEPLPTTPKEATVEKLGKLPSWLDKKKLDAAYDTAAAGADKALKDYRAKTTVPPLAAAVRKAYEAKESVALAKQIETAAKAGKDTGKFLKDYKARFPFPPIQAPADPAIEFIPPRPPLPEVVPAPKDFTIERPWSARSSYRTRGFAEASVFANDQGLFIGAGSAGFESESEMKTQHAMPFELPPTATRAEVRIEGEFYMNGSLANPMPIGVATLLSDFHVAVIDVATGDGLDVAVVGDGCLSSPFPGPGLSFPCDTLVPGIWILDFDRPAPSTQFVVVVTVKSRLTDVGATQGFYQQLGQIFEVLVHFDE